MNGGAATSEASGLWIQLKLKCLAENAATAGQPLPDRYHGIYRIWLAYGFPAFAAVLTIIWLMLMKPDLPI